jgi:hypothetical protein
MCLRLRDLLGAIHHNFSFYFLGLLDPFQTPDRPVTLLIELIHRDREDRHIPSPRPIPAISLLR